MHSDFRDVQRKGLRNDEIGHFNHLLGGQILQASRVTPYLFLRHGWNHMHRENSKEISAGSVTQHSRGSEGTGQSSEAWFSAPAPNSVTSGGLPASTQTGQLTLPPKVEEDEVS